MNKQSDSGQSPPWIFGITNIPFGVAGTYAAVTVPFLLRQAGVPLEQIAFISAIAFLPAAYQLFWAPVIDLGIRRRSWLILCSVLGGLLLAGSMFVPLPQNLLLYQIMLVAGQALVGLVASCNGALVSTTVDPLRRGQAAGWVNAANLGAAMLGGGLVLSLANKVSIPAAAAALFLCIVIPALAALRIKEAAPLKEPLLKHLGKMRSEVWNAVRARRGWTGLLFCISPVGTVALTNLFSGMGADYHVSSDVVELVNGYGGGLITALGALASGFILDRVDRRKIYLAAGVLTAICAGCMAFAPLNPTTYVVGVTIYLLIAGLAYAAFSAVVYEIVGSAGSIASTLYSVFPAAGNQAITYMLVLDGNASKLWGTKGLLLADAGLNIVGVIVLLFLLRVVFPQKNPSPESQTSEEALSEPLKAETRQEEKLAV